MRETIKIKEGKMKQKRWTERCECGRFMPDGCKLCDDCLLGKYELLTKMHSMPDDYETYYLEEDIIKALRKAEKGVQE